MSSYYQSRSRSRFQSINKNKSKTLGTSSTSLNTGNDASFQQRLQEKRDHYRESQERNEQLQDMDAIFSDNPDAVYFQQLMELKSRNRLAMGKSMDDSVIGTETLADMMRGNNTNNDFTDDEFDNQSKDDSFLDYQYYKNPSERNDFSSRKDASFNSSRLYNRQLSAGTDDDPPPPQPPHNLSIVGLENDDLSTIANESIIDARKKKPVSGSRQLKQRDFSEYNADDKKSKNAKKDKHKLSSDADGSASRRTPPGFIRVPDVEDGKQSYVNDDDENAETDSYIDKSYDEMRRRSRRIYFIALCLGVVLLAAIGALIISYIRLRQDSDESSSPDPSNREVTLFTMKPSAAPIVASTPAPVDNPTADIQPTPIPTPAPIVSSTDEPTLAPQTLQPTGPSFMDNANDAVEILGRVSPQTLSALGDEESPQFKAYVWLASDPDYSTYSEERKLQRFAMATIASSVTRKLNAERVLPVTTSGRRLEENVLTWMTYTDECRWVSSHPHGLCDESGRVARIYLENTDLQGRLEPEISLLADSLESLSLSNNRFRGPIPPEFGLLTNLRILDLSGNRLGDDVPSELGNLVTLTYLSLADNNLVRSLPPELGNMKSLVTMDLSSNSVSGNMPSSLGNLTMLEVLDVQDNEMRGFIPAEIGQLLNLASFKLDGNNFFGEMPEEVCLLTRTRSLDLLRADCHEIVCKCCTECSPAPPTIPPTPVPSPTPSATPTELPTTNTPTLSPTRTPPTLSPTRTPPTLSPTRTPPTLSPTRTPPTLSPTRTPPTHGPTMLPSASPSLSPTVKTVAPTPNPTACESKISTNKSCYTRGETVVITFSICDPEPFDWVGTYDASVTDDGFLENYGYWVWTCGTQNCNNVVSEGVLRWNEDLGVNNNIRLHLFRNSLRPYIRFASTPVIRLRETC